MKKKKEKKKEKKEKKKERKKKERKKKEKKRNLIKSKRKRFNSRLNINSIHNFFLAHFICLFHSYLLFGFLIFLFFFGIELDLNFLFLINCQLNMNSYFQLNNNKTKITKKIKKKSKKTKKKTNQKTKQKKKKIKKNKKKPSVSRKPGWCWRRSSDFAASRAACHCCFVFSFHFCCQFFVSDLLFLFFEKGKWCKKWRGKKKERTRKKRKKREKKRKKEKKREKKKEKEKKTLERSDLEWTRRYLATPEGWPATLHFALSDAPPPTSSLSLFLFLFPSSSSCSSSFLSSSCSSSSSSFSCSFDIFSIWCSSSFLFLSSDFLLTFFLSPPFLSFLSMFFYRQNFIDKKEKQKSHKNPQKSDKKKSSQNPMKWRVKIILCVFFDLSLFLRKREIEKSVKERKEREREMIPSSFGRTRNFFPILQSRLLPSLFPQAQKVPFVFARSLSSLGNQCQFCGQSSSVLGEKRNISSVLGEKRNISSFSLQPRSLLSTGFLLFFSCFSFSSSLFFESFKYLEYCFRSRW